MFPLRFTVGIHSADTGAGDDYNPSTSTVVYTPPKDQPGVEARVYGWAPVSSEEPKVVGHDRVIVEMELLVPPGFIVAPQDLIDLDDGQYEVVGWPEDYTKGPFAFMPGKVVNLRKVEG
jgi:hypothetical protein